MSAPAFRIPLLIGGRPRYMRDRCGPLVPLGLGLWKVTGSHKDSVIQVSSLVKDVSQSQVLGPNDSITVQGPCVARVILDQIGNEPHIDVYAERVKI